MSVAVEQRVKNQIREFKSDVNQLEKYVKQWEQELRLRKVAEASEGCYHVFNELQMSLAKLEDINSRNKTQLDCYKIARELLEFFESDLDSDASILLLNHCAPFARLIEHYSDYCAKVERDYKIELDAEKEIRANPDLLQRLKSLRAS